MTNNVQKHINKAIGLELIKSQIQISITKTELNALIAEALSNPDTAATIKRAISPLLADAFPQFPEFTQISIEQTNDDGSTIVVLKQPRNITKTIEESTSPIKSIEPLEIREYVEVENEA